MHVYGGSLFKQGGGFRIDHPLHPESGYLVHSFVESPERKNVYDGVVTLDATGAVVVVMPPWFDALNCDFRYQLTAIGAPAPNLYVASEIEHGSFRIAGGVPGGKVSWQVTGVRKDRWAEANPLVVEEEKDESERGLLLAAEAFDLPPERNIGTARRKRFLKSLGLR